MKKLYLIIVLLIFPLILQSQAASGKTCIWTGSTDGTWETPGNWETGTCDDASGNASYPASNTVKVKFDGSETTNNRTLTINNSISIQQIIFGGSGSDQDWIFNGSDNTITLTFDSAGTSQSIRMNRGNVTATFNIDIDVDRTNQTQMVLGDSGSDRPNNSITFGDGYDLSISNKPLKFTYSQNTQSVIFNGNVSSSSANGDLIFADIHSATFGSTVSMSNFSASLFFQSTSGSYASGTAGGGIFINGPVQASEVRLSATNLTVGVTGSITATRSAATALSNGGTGKFIIQTSQSNSGSIIATDDTSGYTLDFVRTLDSDNEITLLGIPVTDESIQDLIDNGNLRSKSGKSFLGYFDNSNSTYSYYDSSGNSGVLGSGTNNGGRNLTAGTGFIISPDGAGSKDITISGTTTSQSSAETYSLYKESGTYGAYQLVGNPFPAYVALNQQADADSSDNFLSHNTLVLDDSYEQIWAWDGSQWNVYNQSSTDVKHIAPGEGFFIRLPSTSSDGSALSVTFNESMQKTGSFRNFNASTANGIAIDNKAVVRIKVTDLETKEFDKIKLYFSDKSSKGLDKGYDGGKFFIKNSAYMYTRLLEDDQGVDMGIQALPYSELKDVIIPLGLETRSSEIELSFIERDLSDLYNIFLEDRLNNTIVKFEKNLKIELDNEVNGHNRFFLHFTDGLIPELPTDNDLRIFKNNSSNLSIIGNPNQRYKAKIFDYSGRLVKEAEFIHKSNIDELDSRMKILRVESKDGLTVKKFKLN